MDNQWGFNSQEDGTWSNCDYDTKEQAIAAGNEYYLDDGLEVFFVGRTEQTPILNPLDADDLISRTAELIDENYGGDWEPGDIFVDHIEDHQIKDLQNVLEAAWESWIEKHDIKSHSFTIVDVERIEIKEDK